MSKDFDPYHIWLGIPPKDQPPHHFRLLGLELFEDDPEVIDAAANRQIAYLHKIASGPNRKQSQSLMNEIAVARRCLLTPDRHKEYVEQLANSSVTHRQPRIRLLKQTPPTSKTKPQVPLRT